MSDLLEYLPQIVAVGTAVGGALAWLVARLTARRELDGRMMSVALTLIEPLEERVAELEKQNATLRERVRNLESENASLQGEVNELRAENEELRRLTAKPPRKSKSNGDAQ